MRKFKDVALGPYRDADLLSAVRLVAERFDVSDEAAEDQLAAVYQLELYEADGPWAAPLRNDVPSRMLAYAPYALWAKSLAEEHRRPHMVCGRCGSHRVEMDVYAHARTHVVTDDEGPFNRYACGNSNCYQGFMDESNDFYEVFA